jgi:hypothetical protein
VKTLSWFGGVLVAALLAGGCATTTTAPKATIANTAFGPASAASSPTVGTTVLAQASNVFAHSLHESALDTSNGTKAGRAFRSGRALLDLLCNEYLDALGSANQRSGNERKQLGIIGGFASAIMGLTGSSTKEVAGVASAFSFGGSSMDAFTTSFLFSDASRSVTKLVRDAQAAYLTSIQDRIQTLDYDGAVSLLVGYEQICRPGQIRALIDQAVAEAKVVTEDPGRLPGDGAVVPLLGGLMGALGRPVTEAEAIVLYAWFTSDTKGRTELAPSVPHSLAATSDAAAALEQKLQPVFLPLAIAGNPVAKRWAPAVALLKDKKPPSEKAAPALAAPLLTIKRQQ